jgi:hypothetical protein
VARQRIVPPSPRALGHAELSRQGEAVDCEHTIWEDFLANQARLADNAARHAERTRGAPRDGPALLGGLVVCGRCGRQLRVAYKPQPRYGCNAAGKAYGEPMCLQLDGRSIDAAVVEAFFAALAPAELALLDDVLAAQQADHARRAQQYTDQVRRAEYEARLAQRQYDATDPDNRLVAAELERRWELALRALAEAREAAERFAQAPAAPTLDPALRAQLVDLGPRMPELWASGRLSAAQQKTLLRSLIQRVIVRRRTPDTVAITVVWVSGAISALTIQPPIHRACDVSRYDELVARALALGAEGYTDEAIARQLTAEGFRAARRSSIAPGWVGHLRRAQGQRSVREQFRHQAKVGDHWTVWGLSRELGVARSWLYLRITRGTLPVTRHPHTRHYQIADDPTLLAQLRAERAALRPV